MPKFKIIKPRYHNGEYVFASPQYPAIIELAEAPSREVYPKGHKFEGQMIRANEWNGLKQIDEDVSLKPAYAKTEAKHPQSSAQAHGKRTADREAV